MSKYTYPELQGFRWKKGLLWGLLIGNFLVFGFFLFIWITGQLNLTTGLENTEGKKIPNLATSKQAESYATNVVHTYIGVLQQSPSNMEKIKQYLLEGIDQKAGFIPPEEGKPEGLLQLVNLPTIYKIVDKGDNRSEIIFQVELSFKSLKPVEEEEKKKNLHLPNVTRLISIPIVALSEDRFFVTNLPSMLPIETPKKPEKIELTELGKPVDMEQLSSIQSALQNFFKVYGSGNKEEISYLTKSNQTLPGFNGKIEFKNIEKFEAFQTGKDHTVRVTVQYYDKELHIRYLQAYTVSLILDSGKWFITNLQMGHN